MMNDQILVAMTSIGLAVIGVASLSVVLSKNANTTGVVSSLTGGLAQDLTVAESPVTNGGGFSGFSNFNTPSFGIGSGFDD